MRHNPQKPGRKTHYANPYTPFWAGERVVKNWEKGGQDKSFPHIPQVFPQGRKNGAIYISVDITPFDKIELFSSFFSMDKMNNGKKCTGKILLDKVFLLSAGVFFKRTRKNFKKGIDFPEKKGYNG